MSCFSLTDDDSLTTARQTGKRTLKNENKNKHSVINYNNSTQVFAYPIKQMNETTTTATRTTTRVALK